MAANACAACRHVSRTPLNARCSTPLPRRFARDVDATLRSISLDAVRSAGGDVRDVDTLKSWTRLVRHMLVPDASNDTSAPADSEARNRAVADASYSHAYHLHRADHCRACYDLVHRSLHDAIGDDDSLVSLPALTAWIAYLSTEGEALRAVDANAYDALINAWRWCAHEQVRCGGGEAVQPSSTAHQDWQRLL